MLETVLPASPDKPSARTPAAGGRTRRANRPSRAVTPEGRDLHSELRDFAAEHPEGWSQDERTRLVDRLTRTGHDSTDPDAIGMILERERLDLMLQKVQGIGEKRRNTVLDRFGRLWDLRQAGVDEIASLPGLSRPIAERILTGPLRLDTGPLRSDREGPAA